MEFDAETSQKSPKDHDNDVVIKINALSVWTPEEKSWWRRKPTKNKTIILNNVTGHFRRNEFAAVLGPSGAGKTTFLISLAGKCTLPSDGAVTFGGRNVKDCPATVEIVPQHDVFMDSLTVYEHLVFMTEMKLGSCKRAENQKLLQHLMQEFKLKAHTNTIINSLSGGERRLLSLATTLLSEPEILICDEPTTGLDSYNAQLVIGVLKKLASDGRIVICSVHQPSCDLFKEFTSILLMADGKLLFHGTQDACKDVFDSIHLTCPINYNPAEFYMRAVSDSSVYVQKLTEISEASRLEIEETCFVVHCHKKIVHRNWFIQVHLLLWRQYLTLKRNMRGHIVNLFLSVIITALVLTVAYEGVDGRTQRGVQDIRGFLWLITSEVAFAMAYGALFCFEKEVALFKREVGIYTASAYYTSTFLAFIPKCIVWPITLVVLASMTMVLPNHVMTSLEFVAVLVASSVPAVAYGLGMATIFMSTGLMGEVMPCVDLPLLLMSGALLRISSLPTWMYPTKYLSHFYYSMDFISNIYWRQIDYIECPKNYTTLCIKDGAAVLLEEGYSTDFLFQDSFGFLFVTIFWSVLGFCGLKREERKGYAY